MNTHLPLHAQPKLSSVLQVMSERSDPGNVARCVDSEQTDEGSEKTRDYGEEWCNNGERRSGEGKMANRSGQRRKAGERTVEQVSNIPTRFCLSTYTSGFSRIVIRNSSAVVSCTRLRRPSPRTYAQQVLRADMYSISSSARLADSCRTSGACPCTVCSSW